MHVQATSVGGLVNVGGVGPMTTKNFIYFAAGNGRRNSLLRLTDQRPKAA